MSFQVKQCASCGSQMGAHSRECPRCGRGSLFGEMGLIALLGVLLLGIGLASGLIPLDRVRAMAAGAPADTPSTQPHQISTPTPAPLQRGPTNIVPRSAKAASSAQRPPDSAAAYVAPDARAEEVAQVLSAAQCARPDTALIRELLEQLGQTDLDRIAAQACAAAASQASESAQFITPHGMPQRDTTSASTRP